MAGYLRLFPILTFLCGLFLVSLPGCGPTPRQIAARQEAERRAEEARAAQERARQEAEEARLAEIRRLEQLEEAGDQAAQAGDMGAALSSYKEVLKGCQGDEEKDQRLREKIIKFVVSSKMQAPISEEARRHVVRAQTLVKTQQKSGFAPAVTEMTSALLMAPWWADGYYNLGLMQEGAEDFSGAIRSLKLCLLADPQSSNAEAIQTKIYELEVLKEEADKVSSMSGRWFHSGDGLDVTMRGKEFQAVSFDAGGSGWVAGWTIRAMLDGNALEGTITSPGQEETATKCGKPKYTVPLSCMVSQDRKSISCKFMKNEYADGPHLCRLTGSALRTFTIVR